MNKAEQQKHDDKIERLKKIKTARNPCPYNIAALDQATLCGISFEAAETNEPQIELWDLSIGTRESQGMKWLRFESKLKKFLTDNDIQIIAYELPAGRNINPIIHSSKLIAIIEKSCVEMEIEYVEFSAGEVKKFATGNGNANKVMMKEYAKKLWNYEGDDDNEADALHILHLLKAKVNF